MATYFIPAPSGGGFHEIDPVTKKCLSRITGKGPAGEVWPTSRRPHIAEVRKFCATWKSADGTTVYLPPGLTPEKLGILTSSWDMYLARIEAVIEGLYQGVPKLQTLRNIQISPRQFAHWREYCPTPELEKEIDLSLLSAIEGYADACNDRALTEAEDADNSNANAKTLLVSQLNKQAKVHRRDYYGDKVQHQGDPAKPISFIVITGVPKPEKLPPPEKSSLPDIPIDGDRIDEEEAG